MLDKPLDELKLLGNLPSPTGIGLSILKLTQREDFSIGELGRAIQADPALTGRIIRLANSSFGSGAQPAATAMQAAMRLGVRTVRNLALNFTLVDGHRGGRCTAFDYDRFWARSLAMAVVARGLATTSGHDPEQVFNCGLLADIGSLALASIHPERYAELLRRVTHAGSRPLIELEREELDLDHRELGRAMMQDCGIPQSFALAAENYELGALPTDFEDPASAQLTRLLSTARLLVDRNLHLDGGCEAQVFDELARPLAELGFGRSDFDELRRRAPREWSQWFELCAVPGGGSVDERELLNRAEWARNTPEQVEKFTQTNARKGLRILAVDDDSVSLRLLEHHLVRDGHHVVKANNGFRALELAFQRDPQMVVTDWMMPEMDGIELCKALRRTSIGRGMYILILTGREEEARVVEAFDAGADEFVTKPFNPKILLARVRAGQRMIELREQTEVDHRERERQVAEMAVLNRRLETAAMTDVLTRLPNRRYAMRRLEQEVSSANRNGVPLSVIMIDIDHFKAINDEFGHDIGDQVLRETAQVLKRETRKGDEVCRLGGEEFLVICENSNLATGHQTAERIRAAVEEHTVPYGLRRAITISGGVASLDAGPLSVDELLKEADRRVYAAKARGRNQICSSLPPPSSDRSAAG
jgi:diguanylate cyclase (GGDEF)-like protein